MLRRLLAFVVLVFAAVPAYAEDQCYYDLKATGNFAQSQTRRADAAERALAVEQVKVEELRKALVAAQEQITRMQESPKSTTEPKPAEAK